MIILNLIKLFFIFILAMIIISVVRFTMAFMKGSEDFRKNMQDGKKKDNSRVKNRDSDNVIELDKDQYRVD